MLSRPLDLAILIYHSVADNQENHIWSHLSLRLEIFEEQLRYLKRKGFTAVSIHDIYEYLHEDGRLPDKPVALTFDDGFLDSWVFAYPLLKKYGMKGTVFVATDFIDPRETSRPNLEQVWRGEVAKGDLEWWGYLSWPEIRELASSGVMDIQGHAKTHTWYFSTDEIVDFHHPGDPYFWLAWNARPQQKYSWLKDFDPQKVPYGVPVYEFEKALLARRFFPDRSLDEFLAELVRENGGAQFFEMPDWREQLYEKAADFLSAHPPNNYYESEEEYIKRLEEELIGAKHALEAGLNRRVDFLAWPGGGYDETCQELAIEKAGYLATFTTGFWKSPPYITPRLISRHFFGQAYHSRFPGLDRLRMRLLFSGLVNYRAGKRVFRLQIMAANLMRRLVRHRGRILPK
jgi:hypothetical protein